ncbi:MAG: hypothetical protein JXK05_03065 [Campylobacterales bacterium]|nr:hypothetical protein [Campylobacterales bacterium]
MRIVFFFMALTLGAGATNWSMIQSTQNQTGHHPWGFVQLLSQHNDGNVIEENGINKTPFVYNTPYLSHQHGLSVSRFRLGLCGALDEANTLNYFILTELGHNGITAPLGARSGDWLTDASLTFKQRPFYLRIGKFRYSGSEEGMIAQHASPFIQFTTLSDQLMLERFIDSQKAIAPHLAPSAQGVGAYRDSGIELLANFALSPGNTLTLSYMIGNGAGLAHRQINDAKPTHYGYAAFEHLLGKGSGYAQESFKLYGWAQQGERLLYQNDRRTFYTRTRYGAGLSYFDEGVRLASEYMAGSGMLFSGAKDTDPTPDVERWYYEILSDERYKARGYYLLLSYNLIGGLDLLARYDSYDRAYNDPALRRRFENRLLGCSYRINRNNRIDFNYTLHDIQAPHNPKAQSVLDAAKQSYALQYTMLFR